MLSVLASDEMLTNSVLDPLCLPFHLHVHKSMLPNIGNQVYLLQNAAKMMHGEKHLFALYKPNFTYFFFHFVSANRFSN